jgi:hypothetical protein
MSSVREFPDFGEPSRSASVRSLPDGASVRATRISRWARSIPAHFSPSTSPIRRPANAIVANSRYNRGSSVRTTARNRASCSIVIGLIVSSSSSYARPSFIFLTMPTVGLVTTIPSSTAAPNIERAAPMIVRTVFRASFSRAS